MGASQMEEPVAKIEILPSEGLFFIRVHLLTSWWIISSNP